MTFLIMLVILVVLSGCFSLLLPGVDPAGRAIVSGAAGIAILTLVAQGMLSFGLWSPTAGLVVVGVISLSLAVGARLLRPRRPRLVTAAPPVQAAPRPAPRPDPPVRQPLPESAKITRHDGIPIPPRIRNGENGTGRR